MADKRRLFFALWPEPGLQAAIAKAGTAIARTRAIGGREIPAEKVHLTLLFLGDVAADAEQRVITAAGRISARPFDLTLDQAGCFFRSRVFWLGATAVPKKLMALGEDLRAAMAGVGVSPDPKDLVPHVTCVRDIKHRIREVPVGPIRWQVRSFALVHSALGQYHVVSHWPLQNAAS
jgi:RNA 2',3'-cyclic 3'-phosphodiesterase